MVLYAIGVVISDQGAFGSCVKCEKALFREEGARRAGDALRYRGSDH